MLRFFLYDIPVCFTLFPFTFQALIIFYFHYIPSRCSMMFHFVSLRFPLHYFNSFLINTAVIAKRRSQVFQKNKKQTANHETLILYYIIFCFILLYYMFYFFYYITLYYISYHHRDDIVNKLWQTTFLPHCTSSWPTVIRQRTCAVCGAEAAGRAAIAFLIQHCSTVCSSMSSCSTI